MLNKGSNTQFYTVSVRSFLIPFISVPVPLRQGSSSGSATAKSYGSGSATLFCPAPKLLLALTFGPGWWLPCLPAWAPPGWLSSPPDCPHCAGSTQDSGSNSGKKSMPGSIRIRIQHFRLNTHPDPVVLMTKNWKKFTAEKKLIFFSYQKLQFTYT